MKKARNSLGRFEKGSHIEEENESVVKIPEDWTKRIILIFLAIVYFSPWIVMMMRKNTIGGIQAKVTYLYDDVFSCPNCPSLNCSCPSVKNCSTLAEQIIEYGKEKVGL
jgi:hypothetical protein